jgi:hypothetical protein
LGTEDDDRTLTSLIHAISQLHDPQTLARVLPLVRHPNREVRRAVAMSMDADWESAGFAHYANYPRTNGRGGTWATFKFNLSDVDSDEIRQCLRARVDDPEPVIRAEAICALARRHDLACLKQLVDDLGNLDAMYPPS